MIILAYNPFVMDVAYPSRAELDWGFLFGVKNVIIKYTV